VLRNYFKIALRNLLKYKVYSFINIAGLATGVACCLLILLFVQDELSFDRWNENADRIVRFGVDAQLGDQTFYGAVTSAPMAAALKEEFPEVEETARFRSFGFPVIRYNDKVFSEERFYWADSSIFKVFSLKFIAGDPNTALNQPGNVVMTQSMVRKYFGDENPMGKSINSDNRRDYLVTGVIEDIPVNSHFHFDFIASLSSYPVSSNTFWLSNNFYTYALLKEGVEVEEFEKKIQSLVTKYIGPTLESVLGITFDAAEGQGGKYEFVVQPLTDIHLRSDLDYDIEANSDILYVYMFSVIAVLLLLIACINFMNLTTARSANRAKEVGIRKTLGSSQPQLIRQFLVETILMSSIAIFFSIVIVEALLPLFNDLTGKQISTNYFNDILSLPLLIGLAILVGVLAGIYPAFFLSSFKPVVVLKGKLRSSSKTPWLRSGLVIAQFTVSIILIIGTVVVYNQMEFIQNKKLGFDKDKIIIIKKTDDLNVRLQPFMQELLTNNEILEVSNSFNIIGEALDNNVHRVAREGIIENHIINVFLADYDFTDTYKLNVKEGRYFSREWISDTLAVVMNESAVKAMGLTDPVGKFIMSPSNTPEGFSNIKIIGIIEDFHYESLHNPIKPLLIRLKPEEAFGRYLSVRVNTADFSSTLSYIERLWSKYANNQAFEYTFYDNEFARIYAAEGRTKQIVTIFSVLSILIACLGLFGLSSFTTEQRTKEIGVRKVLGASVGGIVVLLSKEFTRWVIISIIIAAPAAYFIMDSWLQNFAYRIDISLWTILLAGVAAIIIALLTVSFQAVRAAVSNPVKALKYE
jgi:putative ABC transport system permease protein